MEISVLGRNMDVGEALTARIESAFEDSVLRYFENAIEGHATITRQQKRFSASLRAHIARGSHVESSASAGDAHTAFDAALERMAKQLRRYKRKLVAAHHHPAPSDMPQVVDYVVEDDPDSTEAQHGEAAEPVIVAETTMAIPTLSVSGAVMRMDLSGRTALFFRHAGTDRLNAVYRRDDGNVGWIDPPEDA
ncbi:MAG: ribosome hibernation-promoting factor, HPF/YfiA family [Alphaproteobacteria bacterium]